MNAVKTAAPPIWCDQGPMLPHVVPEYPYPEWSPYCLRCDSMVRMMKRAFGFECSWCRKPIGPDLILRVGPFARDGEPPVLEHAERDYRKILRSRRT